MSIGLAQGGIGTGLGATERVDRWWIGPTLTGLGFFGFIVYSTFRAMHNAHYVVGTESVLPNSAHLLSPFYSPLILLPEWFPTWFSPAFLILWGPAGFRTTCYYYRKAYYRAYFVDPPGCAVGEPLWRGTNFKGENFLLLFQNVHRFFLYVALIIILVLGIDAVRACIWPTIGLDGNPAHKFGVSVGTIVLTLNVLLLSGYTFGCHSFRHLVGGKLNCFSCAKFGQTRFKAWRIVTFFNERHMQWAWVSLFFVGFTDFYVWMVASGRWTDFVII